MHCISWAQLAKREKVITGRGQTEVGRAGLGSGWQLGSLGCKMLSRLNSTNQSPVNEWSH